MTMTELCAELRNYFDRNLPKYFGDFEIKNGELQLTDDMEIRQNQYFRITGSVFNDGVFQYGVNELTDEVFHGSVRAMAVPPAVIALLGEINEWEGKYLDAVMKPYSNETISGVYSYTKASGTGANNSTLPTVTAFDMFASKLNKWRKI